MAGTKRKERNGEMSCKERADGPDELFQMVGDISQRFEQVYTLRGRTCFKCLKNLFEELMYFSSIF